MLVTEMLKENKKDMLKHFFNSLSCFRLTLFFILFFYIPTQSFIVWTLMFFWAAYLFFIKMLKQKYLQKVHFRKIIYLFLGCGLVTVLIHSEQNLFMNLYMLFWTALCFFSAYSLHSEKSHMRNKKEMKFLLNFISAATTIIMLFSLIMLAIFPKGIRLWGLNFIIYENRFTGIFTNANVLAFYAGMAAICCHMLWKINKAEKRLNIKKRILYIFCASVNIISVFLSDSNATLMFMMTYVCFLVLYSFFNNFKHSGILNFIIRFIATALACVITVSVLFALRSVTQLTVSLAITAGTSQTEISNGGGLDDDINKKHQSQTPSPPSSPTFEHENTNIDSGRFVIWKQAAQLFEKFPVMGIGKANIVSYGNQYIGGLKYNDFHNGLLTILVSFGLVGFNIFMIFAVTVAKTMIKAAFICNDKCRSDGNVLALIISFCAGYCVYSMFEVVLLMQVEYRVFVFWLMLGYGLSYAFRYEKEKRREMPQIKNYSFANLPKYSDIASAPSVRKNTV